MKSLLAKFRRSPGVDLKPAVRRGSEDNPHTVRFDGFSAGMLSTCDGGQRITVCVFGSWWRMQDGDYVIFERRSGETTRYRITAIRTPHDPGDQHFIDCEFAPRPAPNNSGQTAGQQENERK